MVGGKIGQLLLNAEVSHAPRMIQHQPTYTRNAKKRRWNAGVAYFVPHGTRSVMHLHAKCGFYFSWMQSENMCHSGCLNSGQGLSPDLTPGRPSCESGVAVPACHHSGVHGIAGARCHAPSKKMRSGGGAPPPCRVSLLAFNMGGLFSSP